MDDAVSTERPVVAVLDAMPARSLQVIEDIFAPAYEIVCAEDDTHAAKGRAAARADVLLTMWGAVDAETIAAAPQAWLIQKLGVGVDKIDAQAALRNGTIVLKAAGINADAVAELTVLLILAVGRRYDKATAAARGGMLAKEELRAESFQLLGKTVGLLGMGAIGQAVARRISGFGVQIIYHDLKPAGTDADAAYGARLVSIAELLEAADVISLHLPVTPTTRNIVNADFLSRVKPGVIIVNTARGSLVDEDALVAAISGGHVFGAGLDVSAAEPLPMSSPLLRSDRIVLTPHIGGAVANNFPRVIQRAFCNAEAVRHGGTVDPADVVVWPGR